MDHAEYEKRITSYIQLPADQEDANTKLDEFKSISTYIAGSYDQDEAYQVLEKHLNEFESKYQSKERNRLFYMALPPSVFVDVARGLKKNCYTTDGTVRVIVEKPFGKDTDSCRELLQSLKEQFSEDETFRIDHYLGKEMVKNMLVSRFANTALAAGWDKNSISNVQITFKEPFGTEGRGGYFDEFGMIRDVLQNRKTCVNILCSAPLTTLKDLTQVLSIIAMERPVSFSAEDIRDEKACHLFGYDISLT
jgi:glucose-6-phosphate 1-dehydrogenase